MGIRHRITAGEIEAGIKDALFSTLFSDVTFCGAYHRERHRNHQHALTYLCTPTLNLVYKEKSGSLSIDKHQNPDPHTTVDADWGGGLFVG